MQKTRTPPTSRQLLMRKLLPWALIAFLFLFGLGVAVLFSFSSVAALSAFALLFTWVVYGIVKRTLRTRRPIFCDSVPLRYAICAAVILCGGFLIYQGLDAVKTGTIDIYVRGKYSSGPGAHFIFHRATDPRAFWEAVCAYCYLGSVFIWIAIAEVIVSFKPRNHVKPKPAT
ncbi:MAG TPA: hypothetical protein VK815_02550 [Candidatus Acidoferrales bacterium]|jgi:hypothetical protein|nr:hypothetical protein [Candidatus Acidoferrales bacterium]